MKGPIAWFAENGVAANLLLLVIIVAGLISLGGIKKEIFLGDRTAIRERAAHAALGLILNLVEGREG